MLCGRARARALAPRGRTALAVPMARLARGSRATRARRAWRAWRPAHPPCERARAKLSGGARGGAANDLGSIRASDSDEHKRRRRRTSPAGYLDGRLPTNISAGRTCALGFKREEAARRFLVESHLGPQGDLLDDALAATPQKCCDEPGSNLREQSRAPATSRPSHALGKATVAPIFCRPNASPSRSFRHECVYDRRSGLWAAPPKIAPRRVQDR